MLAGTGDAFGEDIELDLTWPKCADSLFSEYPAPAVGDCCLEGVGSAGKGRDTEGDTEGDNFSSRGVKFTGFGGGLGPDTLLEDWGKEDAVE